MPFAATAHFGVGRISDAYFFALTLATFASVVYEGTLLANATPVLQAYKLAGSSYFRGTVRRVMLQATTAAVLTYAVIGGIGGVVAVSQRANWTPSERHITVVLIALLTIYVVASTAAAVLAAGLYALEDFFPPLGSMALRSLVPLSGLLLLGEGTISIEVFTLLLCIGELLRTAVLGLRLLIKSRALRVGTPRQIAGVWATGIPHAAALVVVVANPVIDRFFAAPLGPGSVTVLELGEKILYAPLTALTSFFALVAGVRWAEQSLAGGQSLRRDFRRTMGRAALLATLAAVAVTLAVLLISHFSGGTFAGASTSQLVPIVLILLVGLPGGLMIALGARFLAATRRTRILPAFATLALLVNIGGDYVGSRLLGLEGIALASTVVRYGNTAAYLIVCGYFLRTSVDSKPSAALTVQRAKPPS